MIQRKTKSLVRRAPVVQKREYKQTGLYQKLPDINQMDGRTNIAKTIRALTSELENYVGEITTVAKMLIQRIVYKHMRLSQYENSTIEYRTTSKLSIIFRLQILCALTFFR